MKEERDFAGFVLPFAAGVYSVTGHNLAISSHAPAISTGFLAMTVILLTVISHTASVPIPKMLTALLGFCFGGFIGSSDAIIELSMSEIPAGSGKIATMISDAIDSIRFSRSETNAMIKALMTGDRSDVPDHITEAFRNSGASHILALSGFHLGIIYGIVSRVLSLIGGGRKKDIVKSLAIILLCGAYTLIVGAGASIVRAFLFVLLRETALLTKRCSATPSILISALFIQLMAEPSAIHSVNFQLSYAAMTGIAYLYPRMKAFWPEDEKKEAKEWPVMRKIWNSASLSISCQITTCPLAFVYFGTFPQHFLLTNMIAIPLTGILIPTALITLIMSSAGICPDMLCRLTEGLTNALEGSLDIISRM